MKKSKAQTRANAGLDPVKTETRSDERLPAKNRLGSGKFAPGTSGNPNGRPPGIVNQATKDIHELIDKLLSFASQPDKDEAEARAIKWLRKAGEANPIKALQILANLSEFRAPKLTRTELKAPSGSSVTVKFK